MGAAEFTKGREQVYDKEKYREMLIEAAETVLGYFGIDRMELLVVSGLLSRMSYSSLLLSSEIFLI
jgi:hypothetical protein